MTAHTRKQSPTGQNATAVVATGASSSALMPGFLALPFGIRVTSRKFVELLPAPECPEGGRLVRHKAVLLLTAQRWCHSLLKVGTPPEVALRASLPCPVPSQNATVSSRICLSRLTGLAGVVSKPNCRAFDGGSRPKDLQLSFRNHKLCSAAV